MGVILGVQKVLNCEVIALGLTKEVKKRLSWMKISNE